MIPYGVIAISVAFLGWRAVVWIRRRLSFRWPIYRKNKAELPADSAAQVTKSWPLTESHLSRSVCVYGYEVDRKKLTGAGRLFVEIQFFVFNGSGATITIGPEVSGHASLVGPLREKATILREEDAAPFAYVGSATISYPGSGRFTLRQFIEPDELDDAKRKAESPAVRDIDRVFGDPHVNPYLLFSFNEVSIEAHAEGIAFKIRRLPAVEVPYKPAPPTP